MADLPRVAAILQRIAADVDELARARRVQDLNTAAVLPDPQAERRRRLAEPDLEFRAFCTRRRRPASSTPQLERAWDAWQAERYQRGEISQRPGYTTTHSSHADDHPVPQRTPGPFRKLDAIAVLTGPLLPAPLYEEKGDDGKRKYTVAEIAETFGVSRKTVYRHLEPSGGRRQPGKTTPLLRDAAAALSRPPATGS